MNREVLMATTNPYKMERFKHYFSQLGLSVLCLADIGENIVVVEDGKTPEENALKKAKAGFEATGRPTFGVDYWFYIKGVPNYQQPGAFVRRIYTENGIERKEATDEEMLDYYTKLVAGLGGTTGALWTSAIALVVAKDRSYVERFTRKTILTAKRSYGKTEGEPLNSIQIDPRTGKYFTDLTKEEWLNLQTERERGYIEFIKSHLNEI